VHGKKVSYIERKDINMVNKNIEALKKEFIIFLEVLLFSIFASLTKMQLFWGIGVLSFILLVRVIIKYRKILKLSQ
jgi:hypothetical protein